MQGPPSVRYLQVDDFSLRDPPDDHFTYMFSFGALVHVSFDGIAAYARASFDKMTSGAHCFWMVADYAKYNRATSALDRYSPWSRCLPRRRRYRPVQAALRVLQRVDDPPQGREPDTDDQPSPGRWYDAGIERTCTLLTEVGFRVFDPDVGINHRDPMIHFGKD